VFYFFEKAPNFIRCELRPLGVAEYEIVILEPGQRERIESSPSFEAANARWFAIQEHFRADGWRGPLGRE
jgi:hypothetical protein